MTTIKKTYKGITYRVTLRGIDFSYAQDDNGYTVTDTKTIHALALANN
jgi:hypothetical protein